MPEGQEIQPENHSQNTPTISTGQQKDQRTKFKPVAFALISLLIIFFLYQVVAGGITVFLFGVVPASNQISVFRLAMMFAEFLFILLPTLFLAKLQAKEWTQLLRIRRADLLYILLAIVGVISLQQLLEIYLYIQGLIPLPPQLKQIIEQFQKAIEQTYKILITAHSPSEFLLVVLVVAVTPAICEETLFRGLVQGNFEIRMSKKKAIILTGIIFGAYHLDPFTLIPLCVLGIYLSYLVSLTESILVPVAAHFTNNFVSTLVYYGFGRDSMMAPSDSTKLGLGYIVGWSITFAIIFFVTVNLTVKYKRRLSIESEQEIKQE